MGWKFELYNATVLGACRNYSRIFLKDRRGDAIFRLLCTFHFYRIHRYWPNFVNPRSFSEHIWHKMLNDRDPQMSILADKLAVRDFVRDRIGEEVLVPLLWSGENPRDIPFDSLPSAYVIKTNHGSHSNVIVKPGEKVDREKAIRQLSEWLQINFAYLTHGAEWCYRHIKPMLMVEAFIGTADVVPEDYKFHCINGRIEVIQVDFGRFVDQTRYLCDRNLKPIVAEVRENLHTKPVHFPYNMERMMEIAERLASGLDFVRVDLYNVAGKIYFGEMTNYPGEGCQQFRPRGVDFSLGEKWKLNFNESPSQQPICSYQRQLKKL